MVDEVDRKILSLLKNDARTPFAEIGKRVNLSAPAVHARVKKMESSGVIKQHTISVEPKEVDAGLCAFIRLTRNRGMCKDVAAKLSKVKEIEECHSIAGEDCLILKLRVPSTDKLSGILDQVRAIDGIDRTITMVVLETHFERGVQP